MHSAWYVEDIRLLIFELLDLGDLARLARTNKIFFDPATDKIWQTVSSPWSFVYCLPPQVRSRGLKLEEVERLDFYARKVKAVHMTSRSLVKLVEPPLLSRRRENNPLGKSWRQIWTEIAQVRPNSLFLPNLVHLRISNIAEEFCLPLIGIAGSCLTSIYISYNLRYRSLRKSAQIVHEFLQELQDASKLKCLDVRDSDTNLVPSKLIEHSPLKQLLLHPRTSPIDHEEHQFKQFPLRLEILQKSTLECLTLGLTRQWYSLDVQKVGCKYLPALKTLRLYLTNFRANPCFPSCVNAGADSWTCVNAGHIGQDVKHDTPKDCGLRPPSLFFQGLDNPKLDVLEIVFAYDVSGKMILEMVEAASSSCRLEGLSELSLLNGGWFSECNVCEDRPASRVTPQHLKAAILPLLPLNNLKTLQLTIGPVFLKDIDLDFYQTMADGLPNLQRLSLGHRNFVTRSSSFDERYDIFCTREVVPLRNLAVFCHMLRSLVDVEVGYLDALTSIEDNPRADWASLNVKNLQVLEWVLATGGACVKIDRKQFLICLQTYFPAVDHTMTWLPLR